MLLHHRVFAVFIFGASVFLEIPYQLIAGWVIFLIANVTALEMNWEMAACGLGALLIATYGLHRFFLWIRIGQPWKWSWTISLTTIMLMLFAASIAMTGIIHQLGWMVLEHAFEDLLADTFAGQRRAVAHERLGAVCVVALAAVAGHDPARVREN